ncbi:ArdC-like ssDNA-binding domain-containing protein (plasmid) [Burkholderia aenigmatica]|uniref:ArdC-like ssDNA-binding domain-containing protein n=1 Tax=Burkholderia aenigmatica TaxID=2015348 RepID=UPI003B42DBFF
MGIKTSSPRPRGTATKSTSRRRASGTIGGQGTGRVERCRDAADRANRWLTERSLLTSHPWKGLIGLPKKIADGSPYVGTNVFVLLAEQDRGRFMSALWGSFKALKENGFTVKRDSVHTDAIFFGRKQTNAGQSGSRVQVATAGTSDDTGAPRPDDPTGGTAAAPTQTGSRVIQPVQLFNVAQCVEFSFDPGPSVGDPANLLSRWSECRVAGTRLRKWLQEMTQSDPLEPYEVELVERLGADIAFMRRTGAMDVIEDRLPVVPDLGNRFMKVCGTAYSLSKAIEEQVFGAAQQAGPAPSLPPSNPPADASAVEPESAAAPATEGAPQEATSEALTSSSTSAAVTVPEPEVASTANATEADVPRAVKRKRSPRRAAGTAGAADAAAPKAVAEPDVIEEQPDWMNSW